MVERHCDTWNSLGSEPATTSRPIYERVNETKVYACRKSRSPRAALSIVAQHPTECFNDPIEPMMLSNTGENGVRSLAVQCQQ